MADTVYFIVLVCLTVVSIASGVYWSAFLYHVLRTLVRVPTARAGLRFDVGDEPPRVCVIIPAHNEEESIGQLAESLGAQDYPSYSVVFSLDRCTDRSADIVREHTGNDDRFEILEIEQCPDDWAGKVHALWHAATTSRGASSAEYLLFADADTAFHASCIRATVGLMRERDLGMLSLLSTLTSDSWFERFVQPVASIELMRQYPIVKANAEDRRRAFANGQFIMFRRSDYERIGGHEVVRTALLEDIALARLAHKDDVRIGVFPAAGLLGCRMYETWEAFVRGWKRIYTEAGNRRPKRLRSNGNRLRLSGTVLPAASVSAGATGGIACGLGASAHHGAACLCGWSGIIATIVWLLVLAITYRASGAPLWGALAYPFGAWRVGGILRAAARDLDTGTPTMWGGKAYAREAR